MTGTPQTGSQPASTQPAQPPRNARRSLWIVVAVVAAALMVAALFIWPRGATDEARDASGDGERPPAETASEPERTVFADLYYPGSSGRLHVEQREVPASEAAEVRIASLVEALIAGPVATRLWPPLPADVTVRQVYLMDGGTVFLDLESPTGKPPTSGSQREMLTVYSLVNTVLANAGEAQRLVLLWNGQQPITFGGHVNTARPLRANFDLVASQP